MAPTSPRQSAATPAYFGAMARPRTHSTRNSFNKGEAAKPSLSPFGLVKAVFTHHLRLKRAPRGLVLVLEPQKPAAPPGQATAAPHKDAAALQMHADLGAALNAAPGSRKVFRHLAMVEHKLWHSGSLFLHDLPWSALQRVIEQLDGVSAAASSRGMALLRERLVDAIGVHKRLEREREMRAPPSSFFVDHKLEVIEATPTDFVHAIDELESAVPVHWGS